jgi:hypothetical protein
VHAAASLVPAASTVVTCAALSGAAVPSPPVAVPATPLAAGAGGSSPRAAASTTPTTPQVSAATDAAKLAHALPIGSQGVAVAATVLVCAVCRVCRVLSCWRVGLTLLPRCASCAGTSVAMLPCAQACYCIVAVHHPCSRVSAGGFEWQRGRSRPADRGGRRRSTQCRQRTGVGRCGVSLPAWLMCIVRHSPSASFVFLCSSSKCGGW